MRLESGRVGWLDQTCIRAAVIQAQTSDLHLNLVVFIQRRSEVQGKQNGLVREKPLKAKCNKIKCFSFVGAVEKLHIQLLSFNIGSKAAACAELGSLFQLCWRALQRGIIGVDEGVQIAGAHFLWLSNCKNWKVTHFWKFETFFNFWLSWSKSSWSACV